MTHQEREVIESVIKRLEFAAGVERTVNPGVGSWCSREFEVAAKSLATLLDGPSGMEWTYEQPQAMASKLLQSLKRGGIERNITLIDFVHELYAFWDLVSPGTKHAISVAKTQGKLRDVYGPNGMIIETYGMERSKSAKYNNK